MTAQEIIDSINIVESSRYFKPRVGDNKADVWEDNGLFKFIFVVSRGHGASKKAFQTDYSGGIKAFWGEKMKKATKTILRGDFHVECLAKNRTLYADVEAETCKRILPFMEWKKEDILHSLVMDSDCLDMGFEEWADNYGFNPDSRRAENTFRACQEQARNMLKLVDRQELVTLRDFFADY